MSVPRHLFLIVSGIVFCTLFAAACISTTIGEVTCSDQGLSFPVSHDGDPVDGHVQVTVYRIQDNRQEEIAVFYAPLSLQKGGNRVIVPGTLGPGRYKLYIYLILNGERKAATIRDLAVD